MNHPKKYYRKDQHDLSDGWRRILTSRPFGTASSDLRKTFALFVKRLCLEEKKIQNP